MTQEWAAPNQRGFEQAVEAKVTDLVFAFPALLEKYGRDWLDEFWPASGGEWEREVFEVAAAEAVRLLALRLSPVEASHNARPENV